MKYQYRFIIAKEDAEWSKQEEEFNELGKDGWELVGISQGEAWGARRFIFKKEVDENKIILPKD